MAESMEDIWLRKARDGDQDAFGCLVRAYEKRVFALTRRLCADPSDAEEAAQDAFLAVWQGLPGFRGEASFSTWLYRLTANACTDILRRRQRRSGLDEPLDQAEALPARGPGPQEAAERGELRSAIEAGLRQLPEDYRTALILREIQQLSYEEIAAATGAELGTVKSRISRGRGLLRKFLTESGNLSSFPASNRIAKGKGGRG